MDRINYGNDTATASPKGPLSAANYAMGATGNASFAYSGGGYPGGSKVDPVLIMVMILPRHHQKDH